MTTELKEIAFDGVRYALILRKPRTEERIEFFTPPDSPLQLGAFRMPKGSEIGPHIHRSHRRELDFTTEILLIQTGQLQVDFYDTNRSFRGSEVLDAGDVIVLFEGGHGFRITEDLTMLEIKQGPYAGEADKIRFDRPGSAA